MITKDILYNNLLRLTREFTIDSVSFNTYFDLLQNATREDHLILMSERISGIRHELETSHTNNVLHENFEDLINWISDFRVAYLDFPNHRMDEIELIVSILTKIEAEAPDGFDVLLDVNVDLFCLNSLPKVIAERNFYFVDQNNLSESFILIDISDLTALNAFITTNQISIQLLLHLTSKIGIANSPLNPSQYVLIKTQLNGKNALIRSCISLHILKTGKHIHTAHEYLTRPSISPQRLIRIGDNYQQFNDTIIILSEYNHQRDILDKYMRLYHVVENFMFKYPLVGMERTNGGKPFSIRDFQRMYNKIDVSELSALNDFIRAITKIDYTTGTKFSSFLFSKWTALHPGVIANKSHLDRLLALLKVETKKTKKQIKFDDVSENSFDYFFSQLIYYYRNSLVHNRETEFHLTHDTLLTHDIIGDTAKLVLEHFLIPCIEEIVFFLIIEQNPIVWYDKSKLTLWNEA
ncbi:MAG: hypothetical protein JNM57_14665 [Cyclobacteriaceae bacterium]|nr:hypothetical protein [Cyclobacteriaceae bacterium]